MSVRDTKIKDRVAVGAPDLGHQPAFDDAWTEVEIPDIINSRLDPSARERKYRTRFAPPEQRRGKRIGLRQKGEFNSRHRRYVTKADNNYSKTNASQRYPKSQPRPNIAMWFIPRFIATVLLWGIWLLITLVILFDEWNGGNPFMCLITLPYLFLLVIPAMFMWSD